MGETKSSLSEYLRQLANRYAKLSILPDAQIEAADAPHDDPQTTSQHRKEKQQ